MLSRETQILKRRNKMPLFMKMKEGSMQSLLGADVSHSKLGSTQGFLRGKPKMFAYRIIYSRHIKSS